MKVAVGRGTPRTPGTRRKKICRAPDGERGTPRTPHPRTTSGVRKDGLARTHGFAQWPVHPGTLHRPLRGQKGVTLIFPAQTFFT